MVLDVCTCVYFAAHRRHTFQTASDSVSLARPPSRRFFFAASVEGEPSSLYARNFNFLFVTL